MDDHPRALRLTAAQAGCIIKFRIKPVRSDGDEGHTEGSRPTGEVGAWDDARTPARVRELADTQRGWRAVTPVAMAPLPPAHLLAAPAAGLTAGAPVTASAVSAAASAQPNGYGGVPH